MGFPSRVGGVARADVRARLRRPGVAGLLLAAAVGAWLVIPDPRPGSGLMMIEGARVLYTSPALAFATSSLFAVLLSLFGFYLVSNALERDRRARIAPVVAASPVHDGEYLLGKLLGNLALLAALTTGLLAAAMAMQLARGEGPLEPITFLAHFLVLCGPCAVWVATVALVFECVPGLSGRVGDVLYFFVWVSALPIGAEVWRADRSSGGSLLRIFDFAGLGFMIDQVQRIAGTGQFSLGYSPGDPATPPVIFPGLDFSLPALGARSLSLLGAVAVAPLALAFFRRFDPARTASPGGGRGRSLGGLLNAAARPLARPLLALVDRVSPDAALTFRARPPLVLVAAAAAVLGVGLPPEAVHLLLLPALFAVISLALADVATRERVAGMEGLVFSLPGRRPRFAAWKLGSAALATLVLAGVPVARLLLVEPATGAAALAGVLFLAAASVALGIATESPKTFMAASLTLWYLALNAKGRPPALDYGGWWGQATAHDAGGWLAAALVAAGFAFIAHRLRLARER
jgi:ABC-type transport system involved in multi-copper enzyme maturation permease subunit